MQNNSLKIILMIVTFIACALIGYVVSPFIFNASSNIDLSDHFPVSSGGNIGGGGISSDIELGVTGTVNHIKIVEEEPINTTIDSVAETVIEESQTITEAVVEQPVAQTTTEGVPEIVSVIVHERDSRYIKLGLACTVKATAPDNNILSYQLFEVGASEAKYVSANGRFRDVLPVDGGKYLLKVVNQTTGAIVEKEVTGFRKIDRYSKNKLQEQLSADQQERLFFFHFDQNKLKFDCEGLEEWEVPKTLGAILSGRAAGGWTITVIGTPKYDEYNRIIYFKINVTY